MSRIFMITLPPNRPGKGGGGNGGGGGGGGDDDSDEGDPESDERKKQLGGTYIIAYTYSTHSQYSVRETRTIRIMLSPSPPLSKSIVDRILGRCGL